VERAERQAQKAAMKSSSPRGLRGRQNKTLVLEDQAAMLAHAEQIRAQQLTDEQVEQLVLQMR